MVHGCHVKPVCLSYWHLRCTLRFIEFGLVLSRKREPLRSPATTLPVLHHCLSWARKPLCCSIAFSYQLTNALPVRFPRTAQVHHTWCFDCFMPTLLKVCDGETRERTHNARPYFTNYAWRSARSIEKNGINSGVRNSNDPQQIVRKKV